MTLYEESGGDEMLSQAIDGLYERMLADPTIAPWFENINLNNLKEHQRAFLAVGLGGPEAYAGRSMKNAHAGMGISDEAYTTTLGHLTDALKELNVDAEAVRQIIKRIEMMRAAIVER
jgi:hemoglobin